VHQLSENVSIAIDSWFSKHDIANVQRSIYKAGMHTAAAGNNFALGTREKLKTRRFVMTQHRRLSTLEHISKNCPTASAPISYIKYIARPHAVINSMRLQNRRNVAGAKSILIGIGSRVYGTEREESV
jgi:hypothetical protein